MLCIETNSSGGAERVIANLANYFSSRGHETIVVNGDSDSSFYSLSPSIRVIKMGLDKRGSILSKFYSHYIGLKRLFLEIKPDAVIAFLFNMEAPAILAGLSTKTRIYTSVRNSANAYSRNVRRFRRIFYPKISGIVFQSKKVMECEDFKSVRNKEVIMNPLPIDFPTGLHPVQKRHRKKWIITAGRLSEQKNHILWRTGR